MFSSELQLSRVCRAFCARARCHGFGPTRGRRWKPKIWLKRDGAFLSSGERLLVLVAWSLWSGCSVTIGEVFFNLDSTSLTMPGKLMIASARGAEAVDEWLAEAEQVVARRKSGRA